MRPLLPLVVLVGLLIGCDAATPDGPPSEPPDAGNRLYTPEQVDYFLQVAMGTKFGGNTRIVRRWARDVRIAVYGSPTEAERQTLADVVADVNGIVESIKLVLVDHLENPFVFVKFIGPSDFVSFEPNYVPGNLGFFYANWNGQCEVFRASVLIATEGVTQTERSHLIREVLTQSLVFMNDSNRYPDSMFCAPWTAVTTYAPVDRAVVDMLYRPEIRPCMTATAARRALEAIAE